MLESFGCFNFATPPAFRAAGAAAIRAPPSDMSVRAEQLCKVSMHKEDIERLISQHLNALDVQK